VVGGRGGVVAGDHHHPPAGDSCRGERRACHRHPALPADVLRQNLVDANALDDDETWSRTDGRQEPKRVTAPWMSDYNSSR
jgi:hypothetical protein